MAKKFRIDFFQVQLPLGVEPLEKVLASVLVKPVKDRNQEFGGTPIRLQQGVVHNDFCDGDFIRIQMDDLPLKAGKDGTAGPFDLGDDEGVGHETAFLYYIPLRILLLQRNRSGVWPEKIARYLEAVSGASAPVHLEPLAEPDLVDKIGRMQKFRKFRVKLAGLSRAKQFQSTSPSVQNMLGLISGMSGLYLDLELHAGIKRRNTIDRQGVMNTVQGLLSLPADVATLEKIDISGREGDGKKLETLHLMDFFMSESATTEMTGRRCLYASRAAALAQAWNARKTQIFKMMQPPEKKNEAAN